MAKHLSSTDIQAIVNLIRGWNDEKMTWPLICQAAEPLVGKLPTRQSLNAHEAITTAYKAKKSGLKEQGVRQRRPASLNAAAGRIANLESEIAELREINRKYKQMFVVWQYNAYKKGMREHELNKPLPSIDRERSDGERR